MSEPSLQALQASAAAGGWDWLEAAEKRIFGKAPAALTAEARQRLAEATARIFNSPDGAILLEAMLDRTLRRIVFVTQLGVDPQQALLHGAFREGQNALAAEILRLKAEGEKVAPPPPRE